MAETVSVERTIKAPAEKLWAMVSDVTRMGEWSPENRGGTWLKGAREAAVGAQFKGKNQAGVRRWSTKCTVKECEPGKSFMFVSDAGPLAVAQWDYRFEEANGTTKVTETWTDRRAGIMKVMGKIVSGVGDRAAHNKAGMETTLERLAAAAED
jgi:uncharacterized protein YndB with AHSA1/START domain